MYPYNIGVYKSCAGFTPTCQWRAIMVRRSPFPVHCPSIQSCDRGVIMKLQVLFWFLNLNSFLMVMNCTHRMRNLLLLGNVGCHSDQAEFEQTADILYRQRLAWKVKTWFWYLLKFMYSSKNCRGEKFGNDVVRRSNCARGIRASNDGARLFLSSRQCTTGGDGKA